MKDFPCMGKGLPPTCSHPNCRCSVAYVFDANEASKLNSFEWLKDATEEQKERFLGSKSKRALFDAGLLDRDDYSHN